MEAALLKALTGALAFAPAKLKAKLEGAAPFLGSWDSKLAFRFGTLKTLIEEVVQSGAGPLPLPKQLTETRSTVVELLEKQLRKAMERDRRGEMKQIIAVLRILALTLNRDFAEIIGLSGWTRAGLGVQLSLDGLLNFAHILEAVNWANAIIAGEQQK